MTGILNNMKKNPNHKLQHEDNKRPKWHETEAKDDGEAQDMPVANAAIVTSVFENLEHQWGHIVMIVIGITFFFVFASIIILIFRITGRRHSGKSNNIYLTFK